MILKIWQNNHSLIRENGFTLYFVHFFIVFIIFMSLSVKNSILITSLKYSHNTKIWSFEYCEKHIIINVILLPRYKKMYG